MNLTIIEIRGPNQWASDRAVVDRTEVSVRGKARGGGGASDVKRRGGRGNCAYVFFFSSGMSAIVARHRVVGGRERAFWDSLFFETRKSDKNDELNDGMGASAHLFLSPPPCILSPSGWCCSCAGSRPAMTHCTHQHDSPAARRRKEKEVKREREREKEEESARRYTRLPLSSSFSFHFFFHPLSGRS